MKVLRERGIYRLPDGREFVITLNIQGGYCLYTPGAWEFFGLHLYESNKAGQIHSAGKRTDWLIEDLIDSCRTANSRAGTVAVQK